MSDKVTTALLKPGATGLDGKRGLPNQSRSEKLMALLWTVCALGTGSLLLAPWLTLITKRDLLDNAGIFLALVILAIAYRHYRKKAPTAPAESSLFGAGFLCLASVLVSFGIYFHFTRIAWVSGLAMVAASIWALSGYRKLLYWRPVLLFGLTIFPFDDSGVFSHLSVVLREASQRISTLLAGIFMQLQIKGSVIAIDGKFVEITGACSGLAIFSSLIFLVLLWQLIKPMKMLALLSLCAGSCLIAVLTNSIRLFLTFIAMKYSSLEFALAIHSNLEILLLPGAMYCLWLGARRLTAQ